MALFRKAVNLAATETQRSTPQHTFPHVYE